MNSTSSDAPTGPRIWVNQSAYTLDGPADETVLQFLRRNGLRGTKEGCASGDCGACTVMVQQQDPKRYLTFNSCIAPVGQYATRHVITVEGLAQGNQLHPAQQAMVDCHGSQCGFCTPGFVMSLAALVENQPVATNAETCSTVPDEQAMRACVTQGISGNLCRCTGYLPIVEAGVQALKAGHDSWLDALPSAGTSVTHGVYLPGSLDEFIRLRQQHPEARLIAGGTDLMLEVTQQYRRINAFISLAAVAELRQINIQENTLSIGSAVTYAEIEQALAARSPQWVRLLHRLGSTQIRNQGTLGGNFGNGSPIADMPPAFMVMDAELVLGDLNSNLRRVAIEDFYRGYRDIDLADGEYIHAIEMNSARLDDFHRFYKNSKRIEDDISSVMGAFRFTGSINTITEARIAFGGMAATPIRLQPVEALLINGTLDDELIATAANALEQQLQPLTDVRASAAYRLAMAKQMLVRALREYRGETLLDITEVPHA